MLRIRRIDLHSLSYVDAIIVCINYMESLYSTKTHTPAHLQVEWRRLAKIYKIDTAPKTEADKQKQRRRTQSKFESMTGMGGGDDDPEMGDLG